MIYNSCNIAELVKSNNNNDILLYNYSKMFVHTHSKQNSWITSNNRTKT